MIVARSRYERTLEAVTRIQAFARMVCNGDLKGGRSCSIKRSFFICKRRCMLSAFSSFDVPFFGIRRSSFFYFPFFPTFLRSSPVRSLFGNATSGAVCVRLRERRPGQQVCAPWATSRPWICLRISRCAIQRKKERDRCEQTRVGNFHYNMCN